MFNRRSFIKAGVAIVSQSLAPAFLGGCNGDGGGTEGGAHAALSANNSSPPRGATPPITYSTGLAAATAQMLMATPVRTAASIGAETGQTGQASGILAAVDLTDPVLMLKCGYPDSCIPPVGNQGPLASCVAWSVGYAASTFINAMQHSTYSVRTARYRPALPTCISRHCNARAARPAVAEHTSSTH